MCTYDRAIIISSTYVSLGKPAGNSPGSISFSADIKKGVWLPLSRRKQAWQMLSFKSIENHRSWHRVQVSIFTWAILALKSCIYCHCSTGRKPEGGAGAGGGGGSSGITCGRAGRVSGRGIGAVGGCIIGVGTVGSLEYRYRYRRLSNWGCKGYV